MSSTEVHWSGQGTDTTALYDLNQPHPYQAFQLPTAGGPPVGQDVWGFAGGVPFTSSAGWNSSSPAVWKKHHASGRFRIFAQLQYRQHCLLRNYLRRWVEHKQNASPGNAM